MQPNSALSTVTQMVGHLLDHATGDRGALISALDIVQHMHRQQVEKIYGRS